MEADRSLKRLLVIVPAYNEEQSIQTTLDELSRFPYDFVVVNDGSADSTGDICRRSNVTVIDLPFNQGLASAFQAGMKYAQLHDYDMAIQFDADGQHIPEYIQPMMERLKDGCDIVIGSRFIDGERQRSFRGVGMTLLRAIIRLTTGSILLDPTSGMRIYGKRMIELFSRSVNFGPEPDTIAYLLRSGAVIAEVPVTMRERMAGKSYLGAVASVKYMSRMILSILLIQFVRPKISIEHSDCGKEALTV